MENKTQININIVEENRPNLTAFGSLYGRRIFKAAKELVITDFASRSEKVNHEKGIFITRNVNRYKVLAIDITAIALRKGIEGDYEVVINEGQVDENGSDIEVRCPVSKSDFTQEVTVEALTKALSKDSANTDNVFFSSGKKLAKFLNAENAKEQARLDALRDELESIAKNISVTSEKNAAYAEAYYRQLDGKSSINVHVNIED